MPLVKHSSSDSFGSFATNQHKYHDANNVRSREIGGGDRIPIPGTSGFQGNRFTGGQTSGVLGEKVSTQCQSGGVDSETNCYSNDGNVKKKVFLQSASVYVFNKVTGEGRSVRAVLDSGSTSSYISESLVKTLGLTTDPGRNINVYTFGEHAPKTMRIYGTKVSLLDKANKVWDLDLGVTPTIVGENKSEYCDMKMVNYLASTYTLADECFTSGIEQDYDVLIGNDYYLQFVLGDRVQIRDNFYLLSTVFGHVFSGQFPVPYDSDDNKITNFASTCLFLKTDIPLQGPQNLNFFWNLETLGIKENPTESEDDLALRNFDNDLRFVNGRYYVSFPWRDVSKLDVQTNYGLALGRLGSLLKRHKEDGY
ncbi:hypothetical protein WDU94_005596 [Cyamophila willieti]